ncbi:unnamed protein product, partial [Prorocentrum cordatum]
YPCDQNGQDYLRQSPEAVVQRALAEFRPPREGEADYSALVVRFVRTLREAAGLSRSLAGGAAPEEAAPDDGAVLQELQAFERRYPLDGDARAYLHNSPREVQWSVLQTFKPPREGEADYSALLIAFAKRARTSLAGHSWPPPQAWHGQQQWQQPAPLSGSQVAEAVQAFCRRYPVDESAYNYLVMSPLQVQDQVVREFRPRSEGAGDYSALVIPGAGLLGRRRRRREREACACSGLVGLAGGHGGGLSVGHPPARRPLAVGVWSDPFALGVLSSILALLMRRAGAWHNQDQDQEYQEFRGRFPHDEAAHLYLENSSPEVQKQVLETFRPQREGEADYSALLITYTKRCRLGAQAAASASEHGGCAGGLAGMAPPGELIGGEEMGELELFRCTYPMDDRAFLYLKECAQEVRRQVLDGFSPPRADDKDFSAPVVGFAKLLRARAAEAANAAARGGGNGAAGGGDLDAFLRRYPIDARAQEVLNTAPPNVQRKVLSDFRPRPPEAARGCRGPPRAA